MKEKIIARCLDLVGSIELNTRGKHKELRYIRECLEQERESNHRKLTGVRMVQRLTGR